MKKIEISLSVLIAVMLGSSTLLAYEEGKYNSIVWSDFACEYLSKIENLKIKFLKPRQISANRVRISWLLPTQKEAHPDIFCLSLYKKGVKTPYLNKYISSDINNIELSLLPGKYIAKIIPKVYFPSVKYGRENSVVFSVEKYFKPVSSALIEYISHRAELIFNEASKICDFKTSQKKVKKWLESISVVKKVIPGNTTLHVFFNNGESLVISLVRISGVCGFDNGTPYDFEEMIDVSHIDSYESIFGLYSVEGFFPDYISQMLQIFRVPPRETTCPYSDKAIVIDSISDMPEGDEPHEEYERRGMLKGAVASLRSIGYQVDIKVGTEANLEMLSNLDEGGYGVIVFSGHGGSENFENEDGSTREEFVATVGPHYDIINIIE